MLDKIKSILTSNSEISGWIINEENTESKELFLIKDKLDLNRGTNVSEFNVRVFKDFEEDGAKYKGDSSCQIGISDTMEEIEKKIEIAIFASNFVKNNWYPLPKNEDNNFAKIEKIENIKLIEENYKDIYDAIYRKYPYEANLNSAELFAIEGYRRVVTSEGSDVTYPINIFTFEIVTDSNVGSEPVEIFNEYELTKVDAKEVSRIVEKQLLETEGRSKAIRNKKMENMKVVLSGDAVDNFFRFYLAQANAPMVFQKISKAKLNEKFQSDDAKQLVTIKMNPTLSTSISAKPVDAEGKKLEEYMLFENGVPVNFTSNSRFAHYLNIENKGGFNTFEVAPGEKTVEELLTGEYIEIITFSSFLMDPTTSDFGGEFRLAKHVKDGKVEYITGGSISEQIFNFQNKMVFSKELEARTNSLTPKVIVFEGMTVVGE